MNSRLSGEALLDKNKFRRRIWLGALLVAGLSVVVTGLFWIIGRSAAPTEAPEAEMVLNAQVEMPFQVLIPAYLPKSFVREKTQVNTEALGPQGEPMVQIVYLTRRGESLTFNEWLPFEQEATETSAYCMCICAARMDCASGEVGMKIGSLRLTARVSAPDILTSEEARSVLDTLGPAVNRQIYTSLKEVPLSYSAPPAVEVPINADGVQEVTLVVTPNGYSPEHFAVKKDVPVNLTFRQVGQVGCGNELIFQWGEDKSATLYLATPGDSQTLEFTPAETSEFRFNCPHLVFRGVMTVID
ncbi:MAG: hypothetical protein A2136_03640 [Chloroflexi bacterium RBG_16_54_11]|nr:MAG: hypothetical protein A2136_03640 [Chloroflexi bacterium RBG_16_54_11]